MFGERQGGIVSGVELKRGLLEMVVAERHHDETERVDAQLRREHAYGYCGIVYVDDVDAPTLVKIYDPRNLGTSCSHGAAPIPPRWILSTVQPASSGTPAPEPGRRWRLWRPRSG